MTLFYKYFTYTVLIYYDAFYIIIPKTEAMI